jgi:hypothetical protein
MTAIPTVAPISAPSAWTGAELSRSDEWIYPLSTEEIAATEQIAAGVRRAGKPLESLVAGDVDLGLLAPAVQRWREVLHRGRGFILIRGLPVDRMTKDDAAAVYWVIGLNLGTPVPQNFLGELLTDVRDTGADPNDPSTRLYKTRAEQDFHTDGADIIGLLCLKTSKSGGESRIVSSVSVYNEIVRRRPELLRCCSRISTGTTSSRRCQSGPFRTADLRRARRRSEHGFHSLVHPARAGAPRRSPFHV